MGGLEEEGVHVASDRLREIEETIAGLQRQRHELLQTLAGSKWEAVLRPLNPDDQERQFEFLVRMRSEDHYLRYFSQKHRYTFREIQKLVSVDYGRDFGLAAECCASDRLLGIAQYFGLQEEGAVEMAIVVDGTMQGTGLATVLLDQLCRICRQRKGRQKVYATFLGTNRPAWKLFDKVLSRHGELVGRRDEEGVVEACWHLSDVSEA